MEMKAPPLFEPPAGQGNEASADGLGGEQGLPQTQPGGLPGEVVGDHVEPNQAALAAKRPDGMWLSAIPYFTSRMLFSISAWRRWSASPFGQKLQPGTSCGPTVCEPTPGGTSLAR